MASTDYWKRFENCGKPQQGEAAPITLVRPGRTLPRAQLDTPHFDNKDNKTWEFREPDSPRDEEHVLFNHTPGDMTRQTVGYEAGLNRRVAAQPTATSTSQASASRDPSRDTSLQGPSSTAASSQPTLQPRHTSSTMASQVPIHRDPSRETAGSDASSTTAPASLMPPLQLESTSSTDEFQAPTNRDLWRDAPHPVPPSTAASSQAAPIGQSINSTFPVPATEVVRLKVDAHFDISGLSGTRSTRAGTKGGNQ